MQKNVDLARKVAKKLINSLPKDKRTMIQTSDFLDFLSKFYRREKGFRDFMLNPLIPADRKKAYLENLREKFGLIKDMDRIMYSLVEMGAFPLIEEIKRSYDREMENVLRLAKAHLTLAKDAGMAQVEKIKNVLSKLVGRELEFEVREDPSLIGGFVVRTASFVLDTSVKRNLEKVLRG
ncbi:MAG: ATP synthase F1 subunit delta [Aquificaceae bacterium]